jgi:hypothetical protein
MPSQQPRSGVGGGGRRPRQPTQPQPPPQRRRRAPTTACTLEERRAEDARRAAAAARRELRRVDRRRRTVQIQAAWRGYRVRNAARARDEQTAYLSVIIATMKIQRQFRSYLLLKQEREVREREERLHLWASWVVQSVARCVEPRKFLRELRAAREKEELVRLKEKQAKVIQKHCRGYLQRRMVLWLREAAAHHYLAAGAGGVQPGGHYCAETDVGARIAAAVLRRGGQRGGKTAWSSSGGLGDMAAASRRQHRAAAATARAQARHRRW